MGIVQPRIAKPTKALLFGGRRWDNDRVILYTGAGWVSNGHWLVKADCLRTEARATKGVPTKALHRNDVAAFIKDSGDWPAVSGGLLTPPPLLENVTGLIKFYEATNKGPRKYRACVRLEYYNWLSGLGGVWHVGHDHRTPLSIKRDGETIAVVMGTST